MSHDDKAELIASYRRYLHDTRRDLKRGSSSARQGTRVDGEHRPNNRGERAAVTSSGYLSAGLQQRIDELDAALVLLDRVGTGTRSRAVMGAWLEVEDEDGTPRQLVLLPGGQGVRLEGPSGPVTVLSPEAPLARALAGCTEGDDRMFRGEELVVSWIR